MRNPLKYAGGAFATAPATVDLAALQPRRRFSAKYQKIAQRTWADRTRLEQINLDACALFAHCVVLAREPLDICAASSRLVVEGIESVELCGALSEAFRKKPRLAAPAVLPEVLASMAENPTTVAITVALASMAISSSLSGGLLLDMAKRCEPTEVSRILNRQIEIFDRRATVGWAYLRLRLSAERRTALKHVAKIAVQEFAGALPERAANSTKTLSDLPEPKHAAIGHTTIERQAALWPTLYQQLRGNLVELGLV